MSSGFVSEADLAAMSPQQIMQYIFRAGFSTASQVTNVSGRGVGMDVVRSNVERIGGSIELDSTKGQGTVLTIKIPLTLAIVPALLVRAGEERFAIPQIGVVELVRAGPGAGAPDRGRGGTMSLRLRNRLMPLLSLAAVLGLQPQRQATPPERAFVVVAQVGSARFGLLVDEVLDTEEIVVKPLARKLRTVRAFSGNTILGDGSVVMILDLNAFARAGMDRGTPRAAELEGHAARGEMTSLLLFRAGSGAPKAVPLALVTRLEQVEAGAIEWSGSRTVVQYRGALMPVIELGGGAAAMGQGSRPMLVFSDSGNHMGLVVDDIVDIVEAQVGDGPPQRRQRDPGLGHRRRQVDRSPGRGADDQRGLRRLVRRARRPPFAPGKDGSRKVLVVDDSAFFRGMLRPILESGRFRRDGGAVADRGAGDARSRRAVRRHRLGHRDAGHGRLRLRPGRPFRRPLATTPIIALSSHTAPEDRPAPARSASTTMSASSTAHRCSRP